MDIHVGGAFGWLSPFALLCGVGLCPGHALLGAEWLTYKTESEAGDLSYRLMPWLLGAALLFLTATGAYAASMQLWVLHRWVERPKMVVFPVAGTLACAGLALAMRRRIDWLPLVMTTVIFLTAFGTLAGSLLPYMVPFSITIGQVASPPASLAFMFWGPGLVVLPITVIYTLVIYWLFKGKVQLVDYD